MGGAHIKNWGIIINIGMISHASAKDKRLLGEILWKCRCYHHHVILYHFKYLRIPSGRPFWLLGRCMRTPAPTPVYGPGRWQSQKDWQKQRNSLKISISHCLALVWIIHTVHENDPTTRFDSSLIMFQLPTPVLYSRCYLECCQWHSRSNRRSVVDIRQWQTTSPHTVAIHVWVYGETVLPQKWDRRGVEEQKLLHSSVLDNMNSSSMNMTQ